MCDVTIAITSMGSMKFLEPCLTSIYKFTQDVKMEVIVVAYRADANRLSEMKERFPGVRFIENQDLCGYSENQNIALKQAKGRYALVLNDDTYFTDNSIKALLDTFHEEEDASVISPVIFDFDGIIQFYGRPPYGVWHWFSSTTKLQKLLRRKISTVDSTSLEETYCVSGACFVIKTAVLKELGYFDEYYFGTPDDVALSTFARKRGFKIYLNPRASVFHYGSGTERKLHQVIIPAHMQGIYQYFRKYHGRWKSFLVRLLSLFVFSGKGLYWLLRKKDEEIYIDVPCFDKWGPSLLSNNSS